jgi:hypothetical protein
VRQPLELLGEDDAEGIEPSIDSLYPFDVEVYELPRSDLPVGK